MRFLRLLFGVYCLVIFLTSFIIVLPLYFLVFTFFHIDKAPHVAHQVSRYWAACLFVFFFIRIKVVNRTFIDSKKTYVFVANHLSMLDIPLYAVACNNTFRFLSKAELAKIPFLGYVIKRLYITVNRSDKIDRHRSIEKMKQSLDEHISVFLAPEGTRNISDQSLLDFKDGAFRLAIIAQKPLAILTVINSDKLLSPKDPLAARPGKLVAVWSNPIETTGLTEKDIEYLKQIVRAEMMKNLRR